MQIIKDSIKTIIVSLITISLVTVAHAWTEPSSNPPSGNVSAPINTSATTQYKSGSFGVTTPTGYAQTLLQQWGLYSPGTMYVEPGPGSNLYLTDQWSKTGMLNIQFGKTVFESGNVGIGTTNPGTYKLNVAGTGGINTDGGLYVSGIQKDTVWDAKEPALPSGGTTSQYLRGDKSWQTPTTSQVTEGTNLYFTNARAQAAITGGASTITTSNLTADRALLSNASGKVGVSSTIDINELGYLDGVTSAIQTQLNGKASTTSPTFSGSVTMPGTGIWNSSGNVGIGTLYPGTFKLNVNGNTNVGGNLNVTGKITVYGGPSYISAAATLTDHGQQWFVHNLGRVPWCMWTSSNENLVISVRSISGTSIQLYGWSPGSGQSSTIKVYCW